MKLRKKVNKINRGFVDLNGAHHRGTHVPPQRGTNPAFPLPVGRGRRGMGNPKTAVRIMLLVTSEVTEGHKKTDLHGHPRGVSHNQVTEGRRFVKHEPGELNISRSKEVVNGFIP